MTSIVIRFHFNRLFPKWCILTNRFQAQLIKLGLFQKFEQYNPYPLHHMKYFVQPGQFMKMECFCANSQNNRKDSFVCQKSYQVGSHFYFYLFIFFSTANVSTLPFEIVNRSK